MTPFLMLYVIKTLLEIHCPIRLEYCIRTSPFENKRTNEGAYFYNMFGTEPSSSSDLDHRSRVLQRLRTSFGTRSSPRTSPSCANSYKRQLVSNSTICSISSSFKLNSMTKRDVLKQYLLRINVILRMSDKSLTNRS